MAEDEEKPKSKSHVPWTSQFSMGEADFKRFDRLLTAMDDFATQAWIGNMDAVKLCASATRQLYNNLRVHLIPQARVEMDMDRKVLFQRIANYEDLKRRRQNCDHMINPLLDMLEGFMQKTLYYRQILGFGVEMNLKLSRKKKWERAAGVDNE